MDGNLIAAIIVVAAAGAAIRGIIRMARGTGCCGCPDDSGCAGEEPESAATD